jgi:hypothetical protein
VYWEVDPATGTVAWQTPDPHGDIETSFVTVANGVMYAGSLASAGTNMYALDAATGTIPWSFASGGSVTGGASVRPVPPRRAAAPPPSSGRASAAGSPIRAVLIPAPPPPFTSWKTSRPRIRHWTTKRLRELGRVESL